jgi:hypothetical protein
MSGGSGTRQSWAAEEAEGARRKLQDSFGAKQGSGGKDEGCAKGRLEQAARWLGVISRFQN